MFALDDDLAAVRGKRDHIGAKVACPAATLHHQQAVSSGEFGDRPLELDRGDFIGSYGHHVFGRSRPHGWAVRDADVPDRAQ
ncbi:hypothetical protein ACGF0D_37795, partial [Kitasatospora sp. NPDC048298]|uniref:hypothetical protein n=1 Tax=Kitasatospora sp. NPDC048298 TaxID=3364049 RepID=UPI003721EFC4